MKDNKKKDFLDKLAHDMRTPLSVMQTYMDYMSELMKDEDAQAFHEAASCSFEKLKKLVDSLKNFNEQGDVKKTLCDISELIRKTLVELRVLADEKEIRLTYVGPDHLICFIDSLALERIVQNLVKNAIQASNSEDDRYIEVRLFQRNDTVLLDVRDNGCGISPDNIDKIFEKGITIGDHNGTGIGLAYCKEVIEKHKGSISVHSQLGRGTLFSVILPSTALAACNVAPINDNKSPNFLQIWSIDNNDQSIKTWVERWQQSHNTNVTKEVDYHRFMIEDRAEDSIGMY